MDCRRFTSSLLKEKREDVYQAGLQGLSERLIAPCACLRLHLPRGQHPRAFANGGAGLLWEHRYRLRACLRPATTNFASVRLQTTQIFLWPLLMPRACSPLLLLFPVSPNTRCNAGISSVTLQFLAAIQCFTLCTLPDISYSRIVAKLHSDAVAVSLYTIFSAGNLAGYPSP